MSRNRRSLGGIGVVVLVTVSVGCSSVPSDPAAALVSIRTERNSYAPGEEVLFRVQNGSDEGVVENLCAGDLEHWDGERWQAIMGRACTIAQGDSTRMIKPGAVVRGSLPTASTYPTGEYRVKLDISTPAGEMLPAEERISNVFRLTE